ncbi:MAG: triphosphoribosyl-dephospho-CoA synthase [Synergistaceae bacterium]|jgi:triphosphoribosyl-dephospho-CoA synthetase|nr:triphosphoribosyl-dephospho-CoA synthase [Synergistaceae bacterium]
MTDREISGLAVRALLLEASLSPKPGLVTPYDNGSHKDMTFKTFVDSALALAPCFESCAAIGRAFASNPPEEALPLLKEAGLWGERLMYRATGGVNTHKGAIYLLGFLCAAAGQAAPSPDGMTRTAASFVRGVVQRELASRGRVKSETLTAGERAYLAHGFTGARGEVEGGYPLTLSALSFLRGRSAFMPFNKALTDTFFFIAARNGDTALWSRGGLEGVDTAQKLAEKILLNGGISAAKGQETIHLAQKIFAEKNLSPGGSADILSSAIFLWGIETTD